MKKKSDTTDSICWESGKRKGLEPWIKKKNGTTAYYKESKLAYGPQEENLRETAMKPIPSYRVYVRGKSTSSCIHPYLFFPFPPSQAPLNNKWKLSKCIYNVPHHGLVNSTWQFSDEGMIWTGMCRCSCKLIYRAVLILIFGKISCSALLAKVSCLRD